MAGELIVGFDGSPGSQAALRKALELAKALDAKVVVAYGYRYTPLGGELQDYVKALRELGEQAIAEAKAIAAEAGAPEPETVIEAGDPAEVLGELGGARDAAMVVVGSRKEHPLHGWLLGSVANKLVHLCDVPVLAVPAKRQS